MKISIALITAGTRRNTGEITFTDNNNKVLDIIFALNYEPDRMSTVSRYKRFIGINKSRI